MNIIIIPAKGHSRRLPNKNMYYINQNKKLIDFTIDHAKKSKLIDKIYVSSDSKIIKKYILKKDINFLSRPKRLTGEAPLKEVYFYHYNRLKKKFAINILVGLQIDHPDRTNSVDQVINKFKKYNYDELYAYGSNKIKNGSYYLLSKKALGGKKNLKIGKIIDNCTNIHTLKDLKKAIKNI